MKVGIIGAGNIGQALARLGVGAGYNVTIANSRGPETLAEIAETIACKAATSAEAAASSEILVVTVPLRKVFEIDSALANGKILIDTNNYYPDRDGRIAELEESRTTTSAMVAAHFAGARLVKAFNAILATDLAPPLPAFDFRRALPIAGDDAASKDVVAGLQDRFGFDTVDAGGIDESWRFERAKPAYCVPLDAPSARGIGQG